MDGVRTDPGGQPRFFQEHLFRFRSLTSGAAGANEFEMDLFLNSNSYDCGRSGSVVWSVTDLTFRRLAILEANGPEMDRFLIAFSQRHSFPLVLERLQEVGVFPRAIFGCLPAEELVVTWRNSDVGFCFRR